MFFLPVELIVNRIHYLIIILICQTLSGIWYSIKPKRDSCLPDAFLLIFDFVNNRYVILVSAHSTEAARSWNPSYIQYPVVPACWKSQIVPPEFRHSDMHSPQLCCETKSFFEKPK